MPKERIIMHTITSITNGSRTQKVDHKNRFVSFFDNKTGFYMRTGILDENGNDTGVDPFMCSYPELLDCGIMGSCIHGRKGLCLKAGVQCYQNGFHRNDPNMTLEDYKSIVDQSKGKVFQFALGGRGDPNKHEQFVEILKYTRENGIVPNYTTSGLDLKDEEIQATVDYCGAVAVSWYRSEYTLSALQRFIKAGMKTNIHYVLGKNTIDEAINLLKTDGFPPGINAVIFLMHKPVGLGTQENVLDASDPKIAEFFSIIDGNTVHHKIGFDSCTVPAILNFCNHVSIDSIDTCEAWRYSSYCTADMKLLPCSFDQDLKWAVDLKEHTIEEAWNSPQFEDFRNHMRNSCPGCSKRESCMGGCPIKQEIVICNNPERNQK